MNGVYIFKDDSIALATARGRRAQEWLGGQGFMRCAIGPGFFTYPHQGHVPRGQLVPFIREARAAGLDVVLRTHGLERTTHFEAVTPGYWEDPDGDPTDD